MIRAMIFDKDGTLHDTEKVFAEAWKLAAEELQVPDILTTLRDCTGLTIPAIADYWAKKYPNIPFDEYLPRRQYHFNRIIADGIPVKPGAHEVLAALREGGCRIGMATSTGYSEAMEHLRRTDMLRYFDEGAVITGDMVKNGKPAPDIFRLAAERLGIPPSDCIGVEDSNNGIRAVSAAGMRAVMIPDIVAPAPDVRPLMWRQLETLKDLLRLWEEER